MSHSTAGRAHIARPALVLGEALVDVVDGRRYLGGSCANVAVGAARRGAPTALAGGVGDDEAGHWLTDALRSEGVSLAWFGLDHQVITPVATVHTGPDGEPTYTFTGDALAPGVATMAGRVADAVAACSSLSFTSNTLLGAEERAVTLTARDHALTLGRAVLFDPNLRLDRWPAAAAAVDAARACVPGAFLVKANRDEARRLTGAADPAGAAAALLAAGAHNVVITLGADGALLRSADGTSADAPGVAARPVDTTGAGDAVSAALLAAITGSAPTPAVLAAALGDAVEAGARTTETWGALADLRA